METGDIGLVRTSACSGEARAEALFEQAVVGLCEATLDGYILRVNHEFARMTGYSPDVLKTRHLNDLVHEGADAWLSCVQLVLSDHAPCSLQHDFRQPNGRVVRAHSSLSCVSCDERPCAVLVVSADVTEREQLRLRTIPHRFDPAGDYAALLLENVTDVVAAVDSAWRYTYLNPPAEQFFRKDRRELLGRVCWDVFPELRTHPNSRGMERSMLERRSYAWESMSVMSRLWTQWRCYPLPGGGLLTIIQNIDDRVRAERALRASERLFQALADLVPPMIWTMDNGGNPQWCNRRWLTYTGANSLNDDFADVMNRLHPDDRPKSRLRMQTGLESREPFQVEHRIRRADGTYRWHVAQMQPIADIQGEVAQWMGVATEIHAEREALAAERSARADAEQTRDHVRQLFAELPVMLAVFRGPEHTIEVITNVVSHFFARPLVGLAVRAAFPDFQRSSVFDLLDEVYASGVSRERSGVRIVAPAQGHRPAEDRLFDVTCRALKDGNGTVYGVIAFGLDVTDRIRADTEAERQRRELARILKQAPFAVTYIQGPERIVRMTNDAQVKIIGPRRVLGLPAATAFHEAGLQGVRDMLEHVYATGETISAREQHIEWDRNGDGKLEDGFFDCTFQPVRDESGAIDGVLGCSVDVTSIVRARQEAARALEEVERARVAAEDAREYLRGVVAAVPTPLVVMRGEELVYELVNPAFTAVGGGREVIGRTVEEAFPDLSRDLIDTMKSVVRTGEVRLRHEIHVKYDRMRDGTLFEGYFNSYMAPLKASDGTVTGLVTSSLDVTEQVLQRERIEALRREAEAAREQLEEAHALLETRIAERTSELEEANVALAAQIDSNERAEAMRHELLQRLTTAREDEQRRTARELHEQVGETLNALMLAIKTSCESASLPPSAIGGLADALQLAEDLGRDVNELARRLRPALLDDLGLHAALVELLDAWVERYGVKVDFRAGLERERLPSEVETTLYRVVQEAMTNIARHAQARHVSVMLESYEGEVIAAIADDGVGFDANAAGTRPGLIGVRERVSLAGGALEVNSELGRGTTVIARIPLAAARIRANASAPAGGETPT